MAATNGNSVNASNPDDAVPHRCHHDALINTILAAR